MILGIVLVDDALNNCHLRWKSGICETAGSKVSSEGYGFIL